MLRTGSSNRSPDRSMRSIGRIFSPIISPVDVDEAEYIAAFRTVYHQQATHDLIWENIELFAARYLTTNLRIDVRPFVLSGIDVGADVRDMIVGGDESKTSLSLFGDIATDLPVSFSAEPSFEAEVEGSDRTLFSFPSFTVFPTAEAPVEIEEDVRLCGCADGHLRPGDPHRTEHAAGKLLSRAFARSRTGNYHQPESSQEGRFNL